MTRLICDQSVDKDVNEFLQSKKEAIFVYISDSNELKCVAKISDESKLTELLPSVLKDLVLAHDARTGET